MNTKTAWSDYFTGSPSSTLSNGYGTQQTPSGNVYVSNCLFGSITSGSSGGGAVYCSSSVTLLLVEFSSFLSCKTSGCYGGAIHFSNTGSGQSVLHEVCGYDCYSTYTSSSFGQFSRTNVYNADSSKNYVNCSSISRCVNERSSSHRTIYLYYGKTYCQSTNMSMNKCYYSSAIFCDNFRNSNSVTCLFSYSSFVDNIAISHSCLVLWYSSSNNEIKSCNILRNTQGTLGTNGIIYTNANLIIEGSCILGNSANNIFFASSSSYTITVSNCTVDKTTSNNGLTILNTATKSFILALNHLSTQNCYSEYDAVGALTPNIQSPSPSKKQILYYSCERNICQTQLRDFISLLCAFLFCFIHLDVSSDLFY
jgi:hypothetical protein